MTNNMSIVYIYLLKDPESGEPKYIGISKNWRRQLKHPCLWGYSVNDNLTSWLKDLVHRSLRPKLEILTKTQHIRANWTRDTIVKSFTNKGYKLLNTPTRNLGFKRGIKRRDGATTCLKNIPEIS